MRVEFDFEGVSVLVTGGTSGIGHGIASAFHSAGAEVSVTGTRASVDDYPTELDLGRFGYSGVDLVDPVAVDRLADGVGTLDVLVNNAGATIDDESSPDGFARSVELNLLAAQRLTARLGPVLMASDAPGSASVINMASMSATRPSRFVPGYGAAKAAIVQMTRHLGMEWAERGVRVNAIAPGLILTGMTEIMTQIPDLADAELAKVPMGRWGTPDDVAPTALFLASSAAAFLTGQTVNVDGGYSLT